jgi:dihydroorotate dehydrogenase
MGLINSLGLPSKGMHYGVRNLRLFRERRPAGDPLIIASVGAYRVEELLACYRAAEPWADALEVNFTCPNVHGDQGDFSKIEGVTRLAEKVMAERRKPVLFKLPPRTSTEKWERALAIADVAGEYGAEGISIMGGGPLVEDSRLAVGRGALTGRPAFEGTLRTVRDLRNAIDDRLAIKIAGGVFDGEDAFRLLEAGATYVDILTSFVYLGPSAATQITRELLQKMDAEGVSSVRDLRGRHRPAKISS